MQTKFACASILWCFTCVQFFANWILQNGITGSDYLLTLSNLCYDNFQNSTLLSESFVQRPIHFLNCPGNCKTADTEHARPSKRLTPLLSSLISKQCIVYSCFCIFLGVSRSNFSSVFTLSWEWSHFKANRQQVWMSAKWTIDLTRIKVGVLHC